MADAHKRPAAPEPLPSPVVDNHCHLDIDGGEAESLPAAAALEAAAAVGVSRVVQIGCDLHSARWTREILDEYDQLIGGVSLHPNETPHLVETGKLDEALHEIETIATSHERIRAIGETGLDYYRTGEQGRAAQHESFRAHIDMAKRLDKTLVIHDRDAHGDVLDVLDEVGTPERTVMHCFSGDAEFARAYLDRGCWLSFSGVVTFKNAPNVRDALHVTPMDRILVETDAPFLTPAPHRGKPNASYLLPHTLRMMADALDCELEELCRATDANTEAAYGGTWGS
ncbi:TatD family hydrolase [Solicola gregarius]|uniref:TatD family hydrolase n=1 Tax=Solicola gregarius TaxID=2908642 RepID=A0AA46YMK0_9ACTN|nr:TatD family hydrolase [Solicola gregarius]UYM06596.1 TatD family hydrolase [Solicola gregarius]